MEKSISKRFIYKLICALLVVLLLAVLLDFWSRNNAVKDTASSEENIQESASQVIIEDSSEEPQEEISSPEEIYYQELIEKSSKNCTKDSSVVYNPQEWNDKANFLLNELINDPVYQEFGIDLSAKEGYPYLVAVNRAASTVTVYAVDEDGNYSVPYMAMVCSGGEHTPLGYFETPVNYGWKYLSGPCFGQYATRIWDAYLFHSVPYYTEHKDDLEYDEFNELGTTASKGCIRLAVVDTKWIYDNCPLGTKVVIYDYAEEPGPMGKPGTIYIDPSNEELRGWDPTDPDENNPWPVEFRSGTAIRSELAESNYEAEQDNTNINPTDLQGWSHDSKTEGTRG